MLVKKAGKRAIGKFIKLKLYLKKINIKKKWLILFDKKKSVIKLKITKKIRKKISKMIENKFYNFKIKITSVSKKEIKGMILTCGD